MKKAKKKILKKKTAKKTAQKVAKKTKSGINTRGTRTSYTLSAVKKEKKVYYTCMFKKLLAKLTKVGDKQAPTEQESSSAAGEMNMLLEELKNIFAGELLIDPRIRDFEATTYGNSCRQRCNNIMEKTTQLTEKIKHLIEHNEELHKEKENFATFVNKIFANLQKSSGKLNTILGESETGDKERQLKCYNLGMTVQQSTRALIDAYITTFNRANIQK